MAEIKAVKLNSDELFDKLLEESKKSPELEEKQHKKFVGVCSSITSDLQHEVQPEAVSLCPTELLGPFQQKIIDQSQQNVLGHSSPTTPENLLQLTLEKTDDSSVIENLSSSTKETSDSSLEKNVDLHTKKIDLISSENTVHSPTEKSVNTSTKNAAELSNESILKFYHEETIIPSHEKSLSPFKEKALGPFDEESLSPNENNNISPYEERGATKDSQLSDDLYQTIKNVNNKTTTTNSLSHSPGEGEHSESFNMDDSLTGSFTLTDMQCLDQAVENIIVGESNQSNVNGSSSPVITETYFQKGSHFGLNVTKLKNQYSNLIESTMSNITNNVINGDQKKYHNSSNTSVNNILLEQPSVIDASSKNDCSENIYSQKRNSGDEGEYDLDSLPNNSVFSSPKSKTYPDIYLHKDKINILRQMSQVFNNEKSICDTELLGQSTRNHSVSNTEALDNFLLDNTMSTVENPKETLHKNIDETFPNINDEVTFPKETVNCALKEIENHVPGPIHLVSSNTNSNEKKIIFKSFSGKQGEDIDIIDGFTFVSCDSMKTLFSYKGKGKNSSKFIHKKSNIRKIQKLKNKRQLRRLANRYRNKAEIKSNELKCADASKAPDLVVECNRLKKESWDHNKKTIIGEQINSDHISNSNYYPIRKSSDICIKIPTAPKTFRHQITNFKIKNEKLSSKNEILYLYFGGTLITLAGSINKLRPSNTGPLKGRVVLPNGMNYMELKKKEDLREVSPIEINKDLATFALSALQPPKKSPNSLHHVHGVDENSIHNVSTVENTKDILKQMCEHSNKIGKYPDFLENEYIQVESEASDKDGHPTNEKEASKIRWTQADVIKSTLGSTSTQTATTSKKNIYRFPSLSREMKRLNMNFISYDKDIHEDTAECTTDMDCCHEAYCNLGCICASLKCKKIVPNHCGRIDCMFECTCQIDIVDGRGIPISKANSVSILNLDNDHQNGLAAKEKEFKKTIVQSGSDVFVVERDKKKRDIKLPERYRDSMPSQIPDESIRIPMAVEPIQVSYVPPEDYSKYIKKFWIEMPWYQLPKTVSVWCMDHKCYDCKCLFTLTSVATGGDQNIENLTCSYSSDETLSDGESDTNKEAIEIGTQSSAIICQKLVKSSENSLKQKSHTYTFKYWIHNGEHHSARSCGYEMKNMRFENIQKMPYHYPEPTKPLVMGMTAKISSVNPSMGNKESNQSKICAIENTLISEICVNSINSLSSQESICGASYINGNSFSSREMPTKNNVCRGKKRALDNYDDVNITSKNTDCSRISLHWMIKEEEKRGELELDLSDNTPGRTVIVFEPRFKKLINMCIIGIVGLNINRGCIISTVKSTEDLVKMQKIHQLIIDDTVDVGPNMKEIFCTQSGNKNRYVMVRCDSIGRWEIFGVVQRKNDKTDRSLQLKRNCAIKSLATRTVEANESDVNSDTYQSSNADNLNSLETENYVNESQNAEDCLPFVTNVIGAADLSTNSLLLRENNSLSNSGKDMSNLSTNTKAYNSATSVVINSDIGEQLNGINLASIFPNESKITLKSVQPSSTDGSVSQLTKPSDNQKYLLLPTTGSKKMIIVPIEMDSPQFVFMPSSSSATASTTKQRPQISTSNLSSSPFAVAPSDGDHSYSNVSPSHLINKRHFRPSILSSSKFHNKKSFFAKVSQSDKSFKVPENEFKQSRYNSGEVKLTNKRFKITNNDIDNECISRNKVSPGINANNLKQPSKDKISSNELQSQVENNSYNEGKGNTLQHNLSVYMDRSTTGQSKLDYSSDATLKLNSSYVPKNNKLNSSDDLSLRLDSSSDAIVPDEILSDIDEDRTVMSPTDSCNIQPKSCATLLDNPTGKSPIATNKTATDHTKDTVSPELVYLSSQKLEECSCIDMSIIFKSVKLHWLSGTISKAVLSTITTQSELRGVPISLVVESSGKIIKFYGQYCQLLSRIPILILGTDLAAVKKRSKEDLTYFFKKNPVKYVIKFNDQICTFTYDKVGLNLIRLKEVTRNKLHQKNTECKPLKIPIDVVRGPIKLINMKKSSQMIKRPILSQPPSQVSGAASVVKTGNVPVVICAPSVEEVAGKRLRSNSLMFSLTSGAKQAPSLRTKRTFSIQDNDESVSKKKIFRRDIATNAHLGDANRCLPSNTSEITKEIEKFSTSSAESAEELVDPLEIASNPCHIKPSSLFESSDRKAFGIACYDDNTPKNVDLKKDEDNREMLLKPKADKKSSDSTRSNFHQSSRKQSLKRPLIRDFDNESESIDDTSSCSATDTTSPSKRNRYRVERVAEEHNMKEKLRRKVQADMFGYLHFIMFGNSMPDNRETPSKISSHTILRDAIAIIKGEELLSKILGKKEIRLRTQRLRKIEMIQKFSPFVSENQRKEMCELINNRMLYPSARERLMLSYKPIPLILEEGVTLTEDGKITFPLQKQTLPE